MKDMSFIRLLGHSLTHLINFIWEWLQKMLQADGKLKRRARSNGCRKSSRAQGLLMKDTSKSRSYQFRSSKENRWFLLRKMNISGVMPPLKAGEVYWIVFTVPFGSLLTPINLKEINMKLYADPITGNCRKIMAGFKLMGITYERVHVDYFKSEQLN